MHRSTVVNRTRHDILVEVLESVTEVVREAKPLHDFPTHKAVLKPNGQFSWDHVATFSKSFFIRFRCFDATGKFSHFVYTVRKNTDLELRPRKRGVELREVQKDGKKRTKFHPTCECFPCVLPDNIYEKLFRYYEQLTMELKGLSAREEIKGTPEIEEKARELTELIQFLYPDDKLKLLQVFFPTVLGGMGLVTAAPVTFLFVLKMIGFTATGVLKDSLAALIQKYLGASSAGSFFATLQSIRLTGVVPPQITFLLTSLGLGIGVYRYFTQPESCWDICYSIHQNHGVIPEGVATILKKCRNQESSSAIPLAKL